MGCKSVEYVWRLLEYFFGDIKFLCDIEIVESVEITPTIGVGLKIFLDPRIAPLGSLRKSCLGHDHAWTILRPVVSGEHAFLEPLDIDFQQLDGWGPNSVENAG